MVDRVYQRNTSDSTPQPPTNPSVGYPTGGNPAQGVPATIPGPYWYHMITESLRKVISDAGLEPNHTDLNQLAEALGKLAPNQNITVFDVPGVYQWPVPDVLKSGQRKAQVNVTGGGLAALLRALHQEARAVARQAQPKASLISLVSIRWRSLSVRGGLKLVQ
ncbi:hypothetical protein ACT3TY_05375 [Halomonas sp. AOP22-C1-8]|uniref:hypothetical protein n=1 Tax=Halomonas sp. AOP22-C1-8 TaxID=3457717 RepID=UPI0040335D90